MARYLISDHHFGHTNIIKYCDRPFNSAGEMDTEMLNRFYEVVDTEDTVIHLGDVAMDMRSGDETIDRFDQLGSDLLVRGNHDVGIDPEDAPFPVVESCVLSTNNRDFYCTHRPENIPSEWDGWAIHGHIHNNDTREYPLLRSDERRINISAELLKYRPISLQQIDELVDSCDGQVHLQDIDEAAERLPENNVPG